MLFLDLETRSQCDLRANGLLRYAQDPTTETICMSYAFDDGPVSTWFAEDGPFPAEVLEYITNTDKPITAHNAAFERHLFDFVLSNDYDFAPPALTRWQCSSARAMAHGLPGNLKDVCRALGLPLQKQDEGARLIRDYCAPFFRTEWAGDDKQLMREYCEMDVLTMRQFCSVLRQLEPEEWRQYHITEEMNDRGVPLDIPFVTAALEYADEVRQDVSRQIVELTQGRITKATERKARDEWLAEKLTEEQLELITVESKGVAKIKFDQEFRGILSKAPDLPPEVAEFIELVEQAGGATISKYTAMANTHVEGRVHGSLIWNGAGATGRYASRGLQLQNFRRDAFKDPEPYIDAVVNGVGIEKPAESLGRLIRSAIYSPKGLTYSDYSQIECLTENTQVLTCRGEVPLLELRLTDKLWDGREWVSHQGVVFKGRKEVMHYDGIEATPNHVVYCDDGRTRTLLEAALGQKKLAVTGRGGEALRTLDRFEPAAEPGRQDAGVLGDLRVLPRRASTTTLVRHERRALERLSALQDNRGVQGYSKASASTATSKVQPDSGRHEPQQHEQGVCCVPQGGHREPLPLSGRLRGLHVRPGASRRLFRFGGGSERQHGALREREFAVCDPRGKRTEPRCEYVRDMAGRAHVRSQVLPRGGAAFSPKLSDRNATQRRHPRADNSAPETKGAGGYITQTKAVYDIVNAGPRFRFTANGKLVSNCRVLAWLADDPSAEKVLDVFREGRDVYSENAVDMFGLRSVEEVTPDLRQSAKQGVLACGFGGGAGAVQAMARGYGLKYTHEQADQIKQAWRTANPWAMPLWYGLKDAAKSAVQMPGTTHSHGKISFMYDGGDWLWMRLPSGRCLAYCKPAFEIVTYPWGDEGWELTCLWGSGKPKAGEKWPRRALNHLILSENATQATAADVMRETIVRAHDAGLNVLFSVHDELVVEGHCHEQLHQVMTTAPTWATGLPIAADTQTSYRYGK